MEVDAEEVKSDAAPVINIAGFSTIDEFTKVTKCTKPKQRRSKIKEFFCHFGRLVMLSLLKDLNAPMHFLQVRPEVYMLPVPHLVKLLNFNRTRY